MFQQSFPVRPVSPAAAGTGSIREYLPTGATLNSDRPSGRSESDRSVCGPDSHIGSGPPTLPPASPADLESATLALAWARHDLRQGRRAELPKWLVQLASALDGQGVSL